MDSELAQIFDSNRSERTEKVLLGRPSRRTEAQRLKLIKDRDAQIMQMHADGTPVAKIAQELVLSGGVVYTTLARLVSQGKIPPLPVTNSLTGKERQERDSKIIEMYQEGKTNEEIASALGLTGEYVKILIRKLVDKGSLTAREFKSNSKWTDLNDSRVKIVIEMMKEKKVFREIALTLGVKYQWIQFVVVRLKRIHGDSIFESDNHLFTLLEGAEELGISDSRLRKIITLDSEIQASRRGGRGCGLYLIEQEQLDALRNHPGVLGKWVCSCCGDAFVRKYKNIFCSEACRILMRSKRRDELISQSDNPEVFLQWHKDFIEILKTKKPNKKERWVGICEAEKNCRLTKMQIGWLGLRGIVKTEPNPKRNWRGEPAKLYPLSVLKLAGRIYQKSIQK